ncbi:V-type proton ATPase subunit C 1-B [Megalops cyprinoides]|uniref:V-type proton ATPase subunit C 1-B n=1 Tax=Megalops cyprinoides TaxID=118141 RepID=UPI00186407D6|nr:V-type proton ATPase subunit C 1-B [Megalops cyprinoides]
MTEFWLISVPLDKTSLQSLEKLNHAVCKARLASSFRFPIPELKVGTLDVLMSVSDELTRLDAYAESVIRRISQCMSEVMEPSKDKVLENTLANGESKTHQKITQSPSKAYFQTLLVDLVSYVTRFQWDRAKYSTSLPLKTLTEVISKQVSQTESELKSRSAAYGNLKASLQGLERKIEGSLQMRTLTDVVKKEDLVLGSEYLTTLLVVVPRENYAQWERTYESLTDFVVPRSSRKLLDESEGGIFTVTLFKKAVSDFKAKARQHKFTVREFSFEESEKQRQEMNRLNSDKKEQYGTFVRWLKVNFSEVFMAWIHLKALRVFVESVLRYGLPVSFQTVLLQPDRKCSKALRELLSTLFSHLDSAAAASKPDVGLDIPGMSPLEYYSYIYFKIDINLVNS